MDKTNHKTIHLTVGGSAEVSFEQNPSTGFTWMLESLPPTVWLADVEHIPQAGPPKPGAPSETRKFKFTGVRSGGGQIRFASVRPSSIDHVVESAVYNVQVDAKQPPFHVLYGVALQQAAASGDLAQMKALAAQAEATLSQSADIQSALKALKAEIAKAETAR